MERCLSHVNKVRYQVYIYLPICVYLIHVKRKISVFMCYLCVSECRANDLEVYMPTVHSWQRDWDRKEKDLNFKENA